MNSPETGQNQERKNLIIGAVFWCCLIIAVVSFVNFKQNQRDEENSQNQQKLDEVDRATLKRVNRTKLAQLNQLEQVKAQEKALQDQGINEVKVESKATEVALSQVASLQEKQKNEGDKGRIGKNTSSNFSLNNKAQADTQPLNGDKNQVQTDTKALAKKSFQVKVQAPKTLQNPKIMRLKLIQARVSQLLSSQRLI